MFLRLKSIDAIGRTLTHPLCQTWWQWTLWLKGINRFDLVHLVLAHPQTIYITALGKCLWVQPNCAKLWGCQMSWRIKNECGQECPLDILEFKPRYQTTFLAFSTDMPFLLRQTATTRLLAIKIFWNPSCAECKWDIPTYGIMAVIFFDWLWEINEPVNTPGSTVSPEVKQFPISPIHPLKNKMMSCL